MPPLLWLYLGSGAIVVASLSAFGFYERRKEGRTLPAVPLLERIGGVLMGIALVVPLWPLLLLISIFPHRKGLDYGNLKTASKAPAQTEPQLVVKRADLQEKVSLVEIEAREIVDDPLPAVPNLPFGHLHGVWKSFLTGLEPGCELWSFRSRWTTQYTDTLFEGYVAVKGDSIGPHFRKSQKSLKVR